MEIDDTLREALGIDVIGSLTHKSLLGTTETDWKPFTLFDGTEVLVPHNLNTTIDPVTGDLLAYAQGDTSFSRPHGCPKAVVSLTRSFARNRSTRHMASSIRPTTARMTLFNEEQIDFYRQKRQWFEQRPDCGTSMAIPGTAFGDIAVVPAPFLKNPRGIRDIREWYISQPCGVITSMPCSSGSARSRCNISGP